MLLTETPVSSDTYNAIARYHQFAAASYMDKCPSPPFGSSIQKFINVSSTDSQAVVFHDASANEIILAFRGSSSPIDLDTDLAFTLNDISLDGVSCSGCQVSLLLKNPVPRLKSRPGPRRFPECLQVAQQPGTIGRAKCSGQLWRCIPSRYGSLSRRWIGIHCHCCSEGEGPLVQDLHLW